MTLDFIKSLDNRETAIAVWLCIAITWMIYNKDVRKSLVDVLKAFFVKQIIASTFLMALYIFIMVLFLSWVGIWNDSQFKATLVWSITVGLILLFRVNKISEDKTFFARAIRENFKLTIIIDFIINLHVLSLWIELILLPITALIAGVLAIAETNEKYIVVQKLMNSIAAYIGLSLLAYACWQVYVHFNQITTFETLRSFVIPILFSILYLPFIYIAIVYIAYENVFVRLQFVIKDTSLHSYTKRQLLLNFIFNTQLLPIWLKTAWSRNLDTQSDIMNLIMEIKQYERKNEGDE
ncbi:hypothetical protein [Sulfuricurvum sp.]|uniref:hypothetical protein n=1 Tax=Sulfuricurvum sp. TaxID=2025608 RepID=UPI003C5DE1B8